MCIVRKLSVMIVSVAAMSSVGCSWAPFEMRQQPGTRTADAAQPQPQSGRTAIDVSRATTAQGEAAAATSAPSASLEDRIRRYVKRFPGSDTSHKLDSREAAEPARLAEARTVDVAPPRAPAAPAVSTPEVTAPVGRPAVPPASPPPSESARPPAPSPAAQPTEIVRAPQESAAPPAPPTVESVTVRPNTSAIVVPVPTPEPAESPQANAPNQPIAQPEKPSAASLAPVIAALETGLSEKPDSLAEQLKLRLLYLLDGDEAKALAPAEGMSNEMASLLGSLMKTVASVQGTASDRNAATDEALRAIDDFRTMLRAHAELSIPRVALCRRVDSYGVFEEIETRTFPAGERIPVIIYCEVKNFTAEQTSADQYRTLLSQRLEVLTPEGESVWEMEATDIEDLSYNRREDFFLAQIVHLPASLKPGDYVLNVNIEDKLGAKSNERKIEFSLTPGK